MPSHLARSAVQVRKERPHNIDDRCSVCDLPATVVLPGDGDIWLCPKHAAETAESIIERLPTEMANQAVKQLKG